MKGWSVTLRPNIQVVWLAEHEVIIFTCHQISAHLWLDLEDEAVLATNVLSSGWLLRYLIEKCPKYVLIDVFYQDKTSVVAVWVHFCGGIQSVNVVAVLWGLEHKLRYSDANVGGHHHPEMCVGLVVDDFGSKWRVWQVINHLSDLVQFDRVVHHLSHLLLTELVLFGSAHRILEGEA